MQMLQAREWLCILLLVTVGLPEAALFAQTEAAEVLSVDQNQQIEIRLAAAETALNAGKLDEPPFDNAVFHFQAILEIDPSNAAALEGLAAVQEAMVSLARDAARDLDFELAQRILDDAAQVSDSSGLVRAARQDIAEFRSDYARQLETNVLLAMQTGDFDKAERELVELIALGGSDGTVRRLRRQLKESRVYGGFTPGQLISDPFIGRDIRSPQTVIIQAGSFMMGSPEKEEGRIDNEGPLHRVTITNGYAIGRTEVTVGQFRLFVELSHYRTDADRQGHSTVYNHQSGRLTRRDGVTWRMTYDGRTASDEDPVVHVSWNDAAAYAKWLASSTGKPYRLPTEAEFEYALRAGRTTKYWWGDGSPAEAVENLTGERDVSPRERQWSSYFDGYSDKYWGPAPVASFNSNPFGVHDMAGNVGEWVQDCWHDNYVRAPVDGSAWLNPGCKLRTIRGGYWASSPDQARAAYRLSAQPDRRDARIGFRIARDL